MRKTFRININNQVFNIDEDAYWKLDKYISELNHKFANEDSGSEIVRDIEARIAELFAERISDSKQVITIDDVNSVIGIMGNPDDYEQTENQPHQNDEQSTIASDDFGGVRRLYRDTDKRIIAGVCSGLANYFRVHVVVFRVIFVVVLFATQGFLGLVYIFMWIYVPQASTSTQKLEMKGEKVNISNIERIIRDEIREVQDSIDSFTGSHSFPNIGSILRPVVSVTVSIFRSILNFFVKFIGFFLVLFSFAAIISMVFITFFSKSFFSPGFIIPDMPPVFYIASMILSKVELFFGLVAMFFAVTIPFIVVLFLGLKMLFRFRTRSVPIALGALGIWIVSFSFVFFISLNKSFDFKVREQSLVENTVLIPNSATIYLKINDEKLRAKSYIGNFTNDFPFILHETDSGINLCGRPEIDIRTAVDSVFKIQIIKKASGRTRKEASDFINTFNFDYSVVDSAIILDPDFVIETDAEFRAQQTEVVLYLPVGQKIFIDKSMLRFFSYYVDNLQDFRKYDFVDKFWIMTPRGLDWVDKPSEVEPIEDEDVVDFEPDSVIIEQNDHDDFEDEIDDMKSDLDEFKRNYRPESEEFIDQTREAVEEFENDLDDTLRGLK